MCCYLTSTARITPVTGEPFTAHQSPAQKPNTKDRQLEDKQGYLYHGHSSTLHLAPKDAQTLCKSVWLRAKGKEKQCDWWAETQMSQWNHSAESCCVTQGYCPVHPMGAMCCPGVYQVCNNLLSPLSSSSIYRCCTSLEHLIWYMLKYAHKLCEHKDASSC